MENEKLYRVRVKENCSGWTAAYDFRGQEILVKDKGNEWWQIAGKKGHHLFNIAKKDTELIGEEKMQPELRSGMTFKTNDGRTGLLVGTDKGLVGLFHSYGKYTMYGYKVNEYLAPQENCYDILFSEVYEGMNSSPGAGLNCYISKLENSGQKVWSRETPISIQLNDDYTATLEGETITVGCQKIPLSAVRELVRKADER